MSTSTLASLIVRLGANTGDFETDLGRAAKIAERRARQIGESIRETGVAAQLYIGEKLVQAFSFAADAARQAVTDFGDLADASQKIGTTVESLSTLKYAASQSGVELRTLQTAMTRLAVLANNAAGGNEQAAATLRAIGTSAKDANGNLKSTDVILREAADAFKSYKNGSQEAALAVKAFGRSGVELLPMLNQGADGIAEMEDRARSMGQEISTGAAVAAEQLGDNMNDLNLITKGYINDALKVLLPGMEQLTRHLADTAIQSREAAGGGNMLSDAIRTTVNIFIAFKTAIQQVGVVIAFVVDWFATAIEQNAKMAQAFKESLGVYKTLFTEGPVAAYKEAIATQEKLTALTVGNFDIMTGKFDLLADSLEQVAEDGYKQFEAFNVVMAETAKTTGEAADEGEKLAPVIKDAATAATAAATAEKARAAALRDANRALKEAEDNYKAYIDQQMKAEDAALRASQSLDEYIKESEEWLSGVDDASRDYLETLQQLAKAEEDLQRRGALSAETMNDLARARENAARIRNERQNAAAGVFGGGQNYLADVMKDAVRAAFDERNLGSFFRRLREAFSNAFSRRPGESTGAFIDRGANAILQGVGFIQDAARAWESGATTFERVANVAAMIPGPVGTIAQILQGINALAGGRLFGTAWERTDGRREINVGSGGASGRDVQGEVRQRSLFRGRQWREVESALDMETQRTIDQLFESIESAMSSAADLLGTQVTDVISGSFRQEFDKDGNLTREFATVLGRTFDEGFQEFGARLQAENILAVLAQAFPTDGIQQIAEQWRNDSQQLLEGATVLLSVAATIKDGTQIFTGSLSEVVRVLEFFGEAGESLLETYQRITGTINAYAASVASVQEEIITANLSSFQRAVVQVRRQEMQRIATLNQLAQTIGMTAAREQDLDRVRAASAARIQVLVNELTMDARDLVRQLYQSVAQPASPGAATVPDVIDDAASALESFRQSVQDFIKSLEIDETLSPFGAMERLQRARAMLRDAAGRGDLQSAQQLASATLGIGRDLFASGRDYNALFEEVQGILAGVQFRAPTSIAPQIPQASEPPAAQDARDRLRVARELAQAVADIAGEQDATFADVAASLGLNLEALGADLGLSNNDLISYLESLQADTVDLARVLEELPANIARELAALLQGAASVRPPEGTTPPIGGGGTPPIGGGGIPPFGGPVIPRDDFITPIIPRDEFDDRRRQGDEMMMARLDTLITETRSGNLSNEAALAPIREEVRAQRLVLEDTISSNRSLR